VTKSRALLIEVSISELIIEEPGGKAIMEVEELVSELLQQALDPKCTISLWVNFGKDLSAKQSNGIQELEVSVLLCDSLNVVMFLLSECSSIFFLLFLALLSKSCLLFFELALPVLQE
jgi:hypothetical protein